LKLKLKATVDRNLLQAKLLASKLNVQNIFASKMSGHQDSVRPQNIVRFFEKALKAMKSQKQQVEKDNLDPMSIMLGEFTEKYIEAQISLYIALHYIQDSNSIRQALVILQNSHYQIESALEFYEQNGLKGDKVKEMANELQ
jgi:hypothetical protein